MRRGLETALGVIHSHDPTAAKQLSVDVFIQSQEDVARGYTGEVVAWEAIRLESFRAALKSVGRPNDQLARRTFEAYIQYRYASTRPFDDVVPAICRLRNKYRIGAISNGNSFPSRLGLAHLFDFQIFAEQVSFSKPDRRIFEAALDQAGCSPPELLHVGDDLTTDAQAALDAGTAAVLIRRGAGSHVRTPCNLPTIRNLTELESLLSAPAQPFTSDKGCAVDAGQSKC